MTAFRTLNAHQASLVDRLVTDERARIALVAPTGMGKTRAIMVAVDRIVRRDPLSTNVLIVAPAAIGSYSANHLRELRIPTRVQRLRGTDLRLHEKQSRTLDPGVYFVSTELTRQAWVRDLLVSLPWSLVCVDEAHHSGTAMAELLARLARSARTQRLCAVSATWPQFPPNLDVVTWAFEPGRRIARRAAVVYYERSEEERRVRERLTQIQEEFGAGPIVRAALDSAWRSSASAFEYVLARQAGLLQSPYAEPKPTADPILRERTEELAGATPRSAWADPDAAALALEDLLRHVGAIGRDSKLDAFLAHVGERGAGTTPVAFTAMRQTAIYLAAALGTQDVPTTVIDGAREPTDRNLAPDARMAVVTDAVLPALDLLGGVEGISYDLPVSPSRLEARWSALSASSGEVVMTVLVDASSADAMELDLARKDEVIRSALGSHDPLDPQSQRDAE
jgi:superfamily II DNA or RNA helicase